MDVQALWAQLQDSFAERLSKLQSQEAALDQRAQELAAKEARLQQREAQQAEQAQRLEALQAQVAESATELAALRESLLQGLRTAYGERLQLESALAAARALPPAPLSQQQQQQQQCGQGHRQHTTPFPPREPPPSHEPQWQQPLPPDHAVHAAITPLVPAPAHGPAVPLLHGEPGPGPAQAIVSRAAQQAPAGPTAAELLALAAPALTQPPGSAAGVPAEPSAQLGALSAAGADGAGGYAVSNKPLWGAGSLAALLAGHEEPGAVPPPPQSLQPPQQDYRQQQHYQQQQQHQQQHQRQQQQHTHQRQQQQQQQGGKKRKHHGGGEGGQGRKIHSKAKVQPVANGDSHRQHAKHSQQHPAGGSGVGVAGRGRPARGPQHLKRAAASDSDGEDGLAAAVRMLQAEAGTAEQAEQANHAQHAQSAHQPAPLSAAGSGAGDPASGPNQAQQAQPAHHAQQAQHAAGAGASDPISEPAAPSPKAAAPPKVSVKEARTAKRAQQRRERAEQALASDDPDLLNLLKQHSIDIDVSLMGEDDEELPLGENLPPGSRLKEMQAILDRVMEGAGGSSRQPFAPPAAAVHSTGSSDTSSLCQQYCLGALEGLIERAAAYSRLGQPIRWGWCRPLRSFLFVFEPCNCLVLETPRYGHATWFFDMEEPMPVEDQVRRLVAVLSVRGVSKGVLLEGLGLDDGSPRHAQRAQRAQQDPDADPQHCGREAGQPAGPPHVQQAEQQGAGSCPAGQLVLGGVALGEQEAALLEACGLSRAAGVRSLVNFSGRRLRHSYSRTEKTDWRERVGRELASCARAGRIHKEWTAPL